MKDPNAVIKNEQLINSLGWYISQSKGAYYWTLMTYTPHNRADYLSLTNDNFLEDLESIIEDYDHDDYIDDALKAESNARYTVLLEDSQHFYDKLVELYNALKDIDGFQSEEEDIKDDTREESQDSNKSGNKETTKERN